MNLEEQIAQTLLRKIAQVAEERHLSEEEIKNLNRCFREGGIYGWNQRDE